MAKTNFADLNSKQKIVWSRDVWSAARDAMFVKRFIGTGQGSMIQRITELTKSERGERVLMQLVADLIEDGIVDDNEREGFEESMQNFEQEITISLLSHQVRNKGKMAEQKTVIRFREQARDKLAYWLANRIDQLVFLTLSGIGYQFQNNGAARTNSNLPQLAFAADVQAPSAKRHLRWDASAGGLAAGDTTQVTDNDVLTYNAIVEVMAYMKDHYVKPLMRDGKEYYVGLVKPGTLAQLKKDPDYIRAITGALPRSKDHPWFTGGPVTVDGLVLHEHRLVYSTSGRASNARWGAGGAVNGTRTLICGAQALGMADLGPPEWAEEKFQYGTQQGISVDKMFGLLKPRFYSIYDKSEEDFGCLCLDHALPVAA